MIRVQGWIGGATPCTVVLDGERPGLLEVEHTQNELEKAPNT